MRFVRGFLRVYAWIFETILCALSIAIATLTLLSTSEDLKIGWLPWKDSELTTWMIGLGVVGLLCVLLAVAGRLRILLFLFSFGVLVLLFKGFFFGFSYSFPGPEQAKNAALLCAGAFLAMIGAWPAGSKAGANPRAR